jgi:hypothetical protein
MRPGLRPAMNKTAPNSVDSPGSTWLAPWMDDDGSFPAVLLDGQTWRVGTHLDVEWIADGTGVGLAITSAIPPVFDAYATIVVPDLEADERHQEDALLAVLSQHDPDQRWWIGYLDTGSGDVVVPVAMEVEMYTSWRYGLIEAGPVQARSWRPDSSRGKIPDLIFPADHSWLVSRLWDDDWRCIGGSIQLIAGVQRACGSRVRRVGLDESATPPGHTAW